MAPACTSISLSDGPVDIAIDHAHLLNEVLVGIEIQRKGHVSMSAHLTANEAREFVDDLTATATY